MLTTLDIINNMLAATGTAPVASSSTQHPSYLKADAALRIVNTDIQGRGHWFNTAKRTLRPAVNGEVVLPSNTLSVDPVDTSVEYVMRDGKLYDQANATYNIGKEVEVHHVTLVRVEDLPTTAQQLIRCTAVHDYYLDADGGEPKLSSYGRAVAIAEARFKVESLKHADVNVFDSPSFTAFRRPNRRRRLPL